MKGLRRLGVLAWGPGALDLVHAVAGTGWEWRGAYPGAVQGVIEARDVDQPHQDADDGDHLEAHTLADVALMPLTAMLTATHVNDRPQQCAMQLRLCLQGADSLVVLDGNKRCMT